MCASRFMLTYTYSRDTQRAFKLHKLEDDERVTLTDDQSIDIQDSLFEDESEITSGCIKNKAYKALIVDSGCLDWSNDQLIDKYEQRTYGLLKRKA